MVKILAIIVGFILVPGSLAIDSSEASTPNITADVLIDQAVELVKSLPFAVGWSFIKTFDTKTGHALYGIFDNISRRFDQFDKELPPEVVETFDLVTTVLKGILEKASTAVRELERRKAITGPLRSVLSHYFDPVLERASPQIKAFGDTFGGWISGFFDIYGQWLPEQVRDLESRFSFYLEELEAAKVTLQPTIDQGITRLRQVVEALAKNLKPHLKRFLEENKEYKEEFQQWVNTPIFPPVP